jgi:methionine-rich copper-binding protein CopC
MIPKNTTPAILAATASLMLATQAQAHAKLVGSTPVADTTTTAPKQITLKFNEKVQPNFTGVELTMGGAPVKLTTTVAKDRMTLVGAPAKPFAAGVYQVKWHAVTADTHRMQGTYSFTVR